MQLRGKVFVLACGFRGLVVPGGKDMGQDQLPHCIQPWSREVKARAQLVFSFLHNQVARHGMVAPVFMPISGCSHSG